MAEAGEERWAERGTGKESGGRFCQPDVGDRTVAQNEIEVMSHVAKVGYYNLTGNKTKL